jgi:tetratricopeptide (TPR) repeat protein
MKTTPLLLAALAFAGTADANVWQRAIDNDKDSQTQYEAGLTAGDEAAAQANNRGVNLSTTLRLIDTSISAYKGAAKLRPTEGEPWYRIGSVLNHFFFDCTDGFGARPVTCAMQNDPGRAQAIVEAFDTFEKVAPLDPRVALILNQRAIIRTKLVSSIPPEIGNLHRMLARRDLTDVQRKELEERLKKQEKENNDRRTKLLELAAKDYQSMIDHADSLNEGALHLSYGNLAETYMMVGKLDEAIDAYRLALRARGNLGASLTYGYAVALDRDDQGVEAKRVIRSLPRESLTNFEDEYRKGHVFYVPAGEEEYYFALLYEAFGDTEESIERWQAYIKSGAHPQYQPRAKVHLDALTKQRGKAKPPAPPDDPIRDFR